MLSTTTLKYQVLTLGSLESHIAIKSGRILDLSEQELLDCTTEPPYLNKRCKGGQVQQVFNYIISKGVSLEEDYPYYSMNMTCREDRHTAKVLMNNYFSIKDEDQLKEAIYYYGPVTVSVDFRDMGDYKSGIYISNRPFVDLTHSLVAVGYGTENGVDYWIIKNSYGISWGEGGGYMRLGRKTGQPVGIDRAAFLPSY